MVIDIELLALGVQKILKIFCTATWRWMILTLARHLSEKGRGRSPPMPYRSQTLTSGFPPEGGRGNEGRGGEVPQILLALVI